MDREVVRRQIRKRLESGALPSAAPKLTVGAGEPPIHPKSKMAADLAIDLARCAGCDELGAQVTYRYADGTILRFHSRCHRLWEEECERPKPQR